MNKFFSFILVLTLSITTALAIPAKRGSVTVKNSDGTTLTISLRGDETFHFYVTEDGTPVHRNEKGDWVKDERNISALWSAAHCKRSTHREQLAQKMRRAMKAPRRGGAVADEGSNTKKGLLILVNFKDVKFANTAQKTNEIFTQMVNGINQPYGRNKGSVREYFRAQSYNQLDIHFDVVGPVTVSENMKHYGQNVDQRGNPTTGDGDDAHPEEMIIEALELVDGEVNFADYDWDGDGEVENIYVTYAGYGEAVNGADPNTIWPHQWSLYEATDSVHTFDNVTIDTYACGSELMGTSGKTIEGIGTMCHEYSHCLGLPDFYDCYYNGYVDMADWSVMASGCDNDNGFTPCGYTSYERWYCGWLEPTILNEPRYVSEMKPIEDEPEAYIIYNDKTKNEYYMLANHQQQGWDSKIVGHGMMVLHVDYNSKAWENNEVNTTRNHPRMSIIPADNVLSKTGSYYYADAGDLWPGTKNKTALTDTSTPAATLFNANTDGKKFMHKPITGITEENKMISFSFMGGTDEPTLLPPSGTEVMAIVPTGFTAQWNAVEGAVSYNLSLTEKYNDGQEPADVYEAMLIYEDFDSFFVQNSTSDGNSDINAKLDEYTSTPGWSGEKVYEGIYGAKLGTGGGIGWMATPLLQSTSTKATVYLNVIDWFNYKTYTESDNYKPDGSSVNVCLVDEMGIVLQQQTVQAPDLNELGDEDYPEFIVTFSNVPSSFKIKVSTTAAHKRIYLSYVMVFDGDFTLEEIVTLFDEEEEEASVKMTAPRRAPKHTIVTTTTEFQNITATSYVLTNLRPGATYSYRVQAVDAEGKKSSWSDPVSLTLPEDPDALRTITAPENSSKATLFDLSGRQIATGRAGEARQLSRGVYIMNGRKLFIH